MTVTSLETQLKQAFHIIDELAKTNTQLKETSLMFAAENQYLKSEIIKLQDRLGITSRTSHLPTSKEIYKAEKKSKISTGRKPGAQKGHKHNAYQTKEPDHVIDVSSQESVCACGGSLMEEENYIPHQKIEIPPIKPLVTEYRLKARVCQCCNKKYEASLDNYKLLETNAESIISALGGFFNNSKRDIQIILSSIFNLNISPGLISNSEKRVSDKLEGKYNELKDQAENSPYLHMDETGAKNKDKRHWCWMATNKDVTLFNLANSRSKKALTNFFPEYDGNVISDRYSVYNIFDEEKRQICLAHLRRDFKRFAHSKNKGLSELGMNLIKNIDLVFAIYNAYKAGSVDRFYFLRRIRKLQKQVLFHLKRTDQIPNAEQAQRVATNIIKAFNMMWLFAQNDEMEPTNNFAERQIKHFVKYRKNSLFTWSDRGDRFIERIKSIYASCQLQNLNPFREFTQLLQMA